MFMRNDHLGAPHATATQYIYVDDVMAVWGSIKDRCSAEWGPEKMPYYWHLADIRVASTNVRFRG